MLFPPGPRAPYSNPPIQPFNYKPKLFVISNVELGKNTTIFTETAMDYVIGQQIRLDIPPGYGCVQLNTRTGFVIEIPNALSVIVDLDSSQNVNQFSPSLFSRNQPMIRPVGDVNTGVINYPGSPVPPNTIPGSFKNIS